MPKNEKLAKSYVYDVYYYYLLGMKSNKYLHSNM